MTCGTVVIDGHIWRVEDHHVEFRNGGIEFAFVVPPEVAIDLRAVEYRVHGNDGTLVYIGWLTVDAVKAAVPDEPWRVTIHMDLKDKRSDKWKAAHR